MTRCSLLLMHVCLSQEISWHHCATSFEMDADVLKTSLACFSRLRKLRLELAAARQGGRTRVFPLSSGLASAIRSMTWLRHLEIDMTTCQAATSATDIPAFLPPSLETLRLRTTCGPDESDFW